MRVNEKPPPTSKPSFQINGKADGLLQLVPFLGGGHFVKSTAKSPFCQWPVWKVSSKLSMSAIFKGSPTPRKFLLVVCFKQSVVIFHQFPLVVTPCQGKAQREPGTHEQLTRHQAVYCLGRARRVLPHAAKSRTTHHTIYLFSSEDSVSVCFPLGISEGGVAGSVLKLCRLSRTNSII